MGLSTRIGLDFLVAVAFFVLAVAVCTLGFDVARREAQDIRGNIQPMVSATNHMLTSLERMEDAELLYLARGAGPLKPLEQFDGNATEFETWLPEPQDSSPRRRAQNASKLSVRSTAPSW